MYLFNVFISAENERDKRVKMPQLFAVENPYFWESLSGKYGKPFR